MSTTTDYCYDVNNKKDIAELHDHAVQDFNLPNWLPKTCPLCHEDLPPRGIRSVSLKLNSRNIGDIAVEFYCDICGQMDTLYFRQNVKTTKEFSDIMNGIVPISINELNPPLTEDAMFDAKYNNLIENNKSFKVDFNKNTIFFHGISLDSTAKDFEEMDRAELRCVILNAFQTITWHQQENIQKIAVTISIPTLIVKNEFDTVLLEIDLGEDIPLMGEYGDAILTIVHNNKIGTSLCVSDQENILKLLIAWANGETQYS